MSLESGWEFFTEEEPAYVYGRSAPAEWAHTSASGSARPLCASISSASVGPSRSCTSSVSWRAAGTDAPVVGLGTGPPAADIAALVAHERPTREQRELLCHAGFRHLLALLRIKIAGMLPTLVGWLGVSLGQNRSVACGVQT